MPRKLSDYGLNDFLHLRPLTQRYKTLRYRLVDDKYVKMPVQSTEFADIVRCIRGKNVIATVAFEDPDCLALHLALLRKYVVLDQVIVFDNSRLEKTRVVNAEVANAYHANYVCLPPNPWTGRNGSRSHGTALNWIWHNVLKPGEPNAFGFVDDDLYAIAPTNPFAPLDKYPYYGDIRVAADRWFLWAGFCFYRFASVSDQPLDFGLDWFVGLDTGGANWDVLYKHLPRDTLPARPVEWMSILAGVDDHQAGIERRGDWIHEVGWTWSIDPVLNYRKRKAVLELLAPHLPANFHLPCERMSDPRWEPVK